MKIGKEETMWVAVNRVNNCNTDTLSYIENNAKEYLQSVERKHWDILCDLGWRIKKVKVLITEIE